MNNCLTIDQRMSVTESEIKEYAGEVSKKIIVRENNNDIVYDAEKPEQKMISGIVSGALLAIRAGHDINDAANTAEFIGMRLLPGAGLPYECPHTNCYDTIYIPIMRFVRIVEHRTKMERREAKNEYQAV